MTDQPANHFTIPMTAWGEFVAKITKLNKRAKKLGCEPITYELLGEGETERSHTFKTEDGEYTKYYKVKTRTIELHGKAPKIEGFAFVAKIEYLSDNKSVLFHSVPGSEIKIDERFRTLKPSICEHCHKVRSRKETFVVLNIETGAQTQVGRQCLADFTGINTPEKLAAMASCLSSYSDLREESERWWGGHFANTIDTHHALALTSAYIAQNGWTPKSACPEGGMSTAGSVSMHFWGMPPKDEAKSGMKAMAELAKQPEHQDRASRVVTWIKTELADKARSDYEMNLVTLVANDLTEQKHLGIVCSAVAAYQRAMNQKVEYAKKREALTNSQYVGKVGERLRGIVAKIQQVRALEANEWGPRSMVKFLDSNGNLMTWFASGDRDYTPGAAATITGTVKAHSEYQGVKETLLSRVVVSFPEMVAA
jgi:hypothetical protein